MTQERHALPVLKSEPNATAAAKGESRASRRILRPPPIVPPVDLPQSNDRILIKAQPSESGDHCTFLANRVLLAGYSWCFGNPDAAKASPLAAAVLELTPVQELVVDGSTVVVCLREGADVDWSALATTVGGIIRRELEKGREIVPASVFADIPSEDAIRVSVQAVLDHEINPGVAAHSGQISLLSVRGNTVRIEMGGGCQGCRAADLTLKSTVQRLFRDAVPTIGAIYDETDHSNGLSPFFA